MVHVQPQVSPLRYALVEMTKLWKALSGSAYVINITFPFRSQAAAHGSLLCLMHRFIDLIEAAYSEEQLMKFIHLHRGV